MSTLRAILLWLASALALALPAGAELAPPARDMAVGLSGVVDWSVQQPFLDVMKTARPWVGHRHGEWGGVDYDALVERGLLRPDGWPARIPEDLRAIGTILLTDLPVEAVSLSGRYLMTWRGSGRLQLAGRADNLRYPGHNTIRFDFRPGDGGVILNIRRTDPDDPIRDIRIVKLDHLAAYQAGAVFNPDWTGRIGAFGTLRFMDWMVTNDSTVSDWQDRPRARDVTYTRNGAPLEIMLRLANELDADPWFNMPHLATDDYMRRFAETVQAGLAPGRRVYVEFSNEVWNWQFGQARWAEAQGIARWGQKYTGVQYYGMRAAEMAAIWREVFGPGDRLVTVIATQTGWLGREADLLEAPLWVAEVPGRQSPASHFDAYAVTGYFSALLGHEDKVDTVRGWLARSLAAAEAGAEGMTGAARDAFVAAHRYDVAVALAVRELRDGSVTGDPRDSLKALFTEVLPYHRAVADRYGLDLVMYEGGTHVVGTGPATEDAALTDFFVHLNYAPEMGDLYREALAGWNSVGGQLFNVFVDVARPGRWGSWGALRHLDDDNPRWRALVGPAPETGQ